MVLIRTDAAGGTHALIDYLTTQKLSYSIGFGLTDTIVTAIDALSEHAWIPAYNADGQPRDGAWVTEVTSLLELPGWPDGMRVTVRKERPHPGAQLRFTDRDGLRLTAFVTNTEGGQLPDLELRHRRRARCEDRIRILKDTGLENLPLHGFDQNRIWLALVALAVEVTAWMQKLALTDDQASRWEPKRLRLRLFATAGRIARHARKVHLRLSAHAPWIDLLIRIGPSQRNPRPPLTSTNPTIETKGNQPSRPWTPTTTRPRRATTRCRAPNPRPKHPTRNAIAGGSHSRAGDDAPAVPGPLSGTSTTEPRTRHRASASCVSSGLSATPRPSCSEAFSSR